MEDNPSNVREVIKKICEQQGGLNVLKSDYLAAMLDDYFPGDHREKKIVKNALRLGAGKEFCKIYTSFGSFNEAARAKFKMIFLNDIGMGDDAYRIVVDAFWYAVDPEGAIAEIKAEEARKAEVARKAEDEIDFGLDNESADSEEERRKKEAMPAVGSIITFGKYPTTKNGTIRDIDWRVLKVEGKKALLISKYGIDAKPYNVERVDVTWENCSLRKWLNGDFLSTAFSSEEKRKILDTRVKAEKNPEFRTKPGNDTVDRIFLLSIQEAESFFKNDNDRMCEPTDYANKNGARTNVNYEVGGKLTCWWWLRSPGDSQDGAAYVIDLGWVFSNGNYVSDDDVCVRPALWINLESTETELREEIEDEETSENTGHKEIENARTEAFSEKSVPTVGATITLGKYPTSADGLEKDLEWCVLKIEGKKALLISSYGIDAKPYNVKKVHITWENCSLRKWLNGDFLSTAFSSEEKRKILDTRVKAEKNPEFRTKPGNDTVDRIFLLSIQEAESFFINDNDRMCVPTDYAKMNGAYAHDYYKVGGEPTCWWWLRSPGSHQYRAADVSSGGSVGSYGRVSSGGVCVRPALWINLES